LERVLCENKTFGDKTTNKKTFYIKPRLDLEPKILEILLINLF